MRAIFWRGRLRRARGTLRDLLFGRFFAKAPERPNASLRLTSGRTGRFRVCLRAGCNFVLLAFHLLVTCFSGRGKGLLRV